MQRENHTIDASNQSLGRLATQIATLLRGKHKPEYEHNKDTGDRVVVENIDHLKVTGNKALQKIYYSYSGYPGGLKETSLKDLADKKGMGEVLKRAVWNMLPKNKLRNDMIKRLVIK